MRIALGAWVLMSGKHLRQVTVTDAAVSSVMTLTAFYPFLRSLWLTLF